MFPSNKAFEYPFQVRNHSWQRKTSYEFARASLDMAERAWLARSRIVRETLRIGLENFEKEAFRAARLISQRRLTLTYPADAKEM